MRTSPLLLLLAACATTPAAPEAAGPALTFIENDYPAALALARERGVPLLTDGWAPWCHTCLSMKSEVFTDERLRPLADRFVFLAIDTERDDSAAFLEKYPQKVWPTLHVIDPRDERVVLRWPGSATAPQLIALLEDGERALRGGAEGAEALLARADRLDGEGDAAGAAAALEEALSRTDSSWPRRGRAVESLVMLRYFGLSDAAGCARLAQTELATLPRGSSWANIAGLGLSCATSVKDVPGFHEQVSPSIESALRAAIADRSIEMAPDDRSGLYEILHGFRDARGDEAGKKEIAKEWLSFLEAESARATDPKSRAVFDSHIVSAAIHLGEPARALPPLLASERELPGDYNAPARQALIYLKLGKLDEALAASDRALALVYGPRRARVLNDRGDILRARGDVEGARAAWTEARAVAEGFPEKRRPRRDLARAIQSLEGLATP